MTLEEPRPNLVLQIGDLAGEGLLGYVEANRRTGEAAFVGDRHKVTQVAEFHWSLAGCTLA